MRLYLSHFVKLLGHFRILNVQLSALYLEFGSYHIHRHKIVVDTRVPGLTIAIHNAFKSSCLGMDTHYILVYAYILPIYMYMYMTMKEIYIQL